MHVNGEVNSRVLDAMVTETVPPSPPEPEYIVVGGALIMLLSTSVTVTGIDVVAVSEIEVVATTVNTVCKAVERAVDWPEMIVDITAV
jgi:hypothetical protein